MPLIYILDDDDDTLFAMEYWLKRKGYVIKTFMDSLQMLQVIEETTPDVVLLDVYLNGEDGREVCLYLKNKVEFKVPVFLISTYIDCSNDFTNYRADGFVQKPYSMKELASTIESKIMA